MKIKKTKLNVEDYSKALDIWERSVSETHEFLKIEDRKALKNEIPTYFKYVEAYLWWDGFEVIGFSGTNDQQLEMLFLDPQFINKGYGTKIVQSLIKENKIQYVDVNKDNKNAVRFYKKNGFIKYDESERDGQGRAYPILHLKLSE